MESPDAPFSASSSFAGFTASVLQLFIPPVKNFFIVFIMLRFSLGVLTLPAEILRLNQKFDIFFAVLDLYQNCRK